MKQYLIYCVLGAVTTSVGVPVCAQEPEKPVYVVTVASEPALEEAKTESTAMTVVTRNELDHKAARTLEQALVGQQSVQLGTDDMGRQTVSIRGAEPRHTLILVDGHRQMGGLSKFAGAVDEIQRISTDEVDHIEILRGAESTKYGADAMGGVVNVIRKMPSQPGLILRMEQGGLEHGGKQYNRSVALHTGEQGPFNLSVSYGGYRNAPFQYDEQGASMQYFGLRQPMDARLQIKFGKNHRVLLEKGILTENLKKITQLGGSFHLTAKEHATRHTQGVTWYGQHGKYDFSMGARQSKYDSDTNFVVRDLQVVIPYLHPFFDTVVHSDDTLQARVGFAPNDAHYLTLRAEHHTERAEGTRITVPGVEAKDVERTYTFPNPSDPANPTRVTARGASNDAKIHSHSFALDDTWQYNDKLLILPALRYDGNSKFGGHLSAKMGATYSVRPNVRIKANVGTGFSAPGVAELYHDWEMYEPSLQQKPPFRNGWLFKGNPDLKPEKSLNMDLSVEADINRNTSIKASLFRNDFRDFMQVVYDGEQPSKNLNGFTHYDPNIRYAGEGREVDYPEYDTIEDFLADIEGATNAEKLEKAKDLGFIHKIPALDDIFTYKNIARARMQGLELEIQHAFSKRLQLKAGYTLLDARDRDTGKRLEGRGHHMFNLSLHYEHEKSGWGVTFWGNYTQGYLDIRDREETGKLVGQGDAPQPVLVLPNPKGDPVKIFRNAKEAYDYSDTYDKYHAFTKEKLAKSKNFGVWNILFEKKMSADNTLYFGATNIFDKRDDYLGLGGRIYRVGMKLKI